MGTSDDLSERFRQHYRGRVRVANSVSREVRGHSDATLAPDSTDQEFRKREAATRAVHGFLLGDRTLPLVKLQEEDLDEVAEVAAQLKALSRDKEKRHGGEAEIIVLALRAREAKGGRHILLANDGGASVVAASRGIPARHAADVLAELSCADSTLEAESCLAVFGLSLAVSAPPAHCRPADAEAFTCRAGRDGCPPCDSVDGAA
jgi:hypothetical protein